MIAAKSPSPRKLGERPVEFEVKSSPRRIGISTSVIQRGKSGVAQYLFALLRAFAAQNSGDKFTLFVLEADLPLFSFLANHMTMVPVPEEFRSPVRNIWWHQTALPRLCEQHQIEVLHVPSYRRMLWRAPCARVVTIHDLAPFHVKGKYDWKRMFYGKVVAKKLAARQEQIIAISQNTAADIDRFFGIGSRKLKVVYNGLDHARFFPAPPTKLWPGLDRPFFLYVSRLEHPAKNHVRLIRAFDHFKTKTGSPWMLVFAGGDWHGSEIIHQAIQNSPFREAIRCLGFVPDAGLPDLYRQAAAFVYPSLFEGFGMPPVEAMACGCPVISSARGSLAEVVGEAALIIDPESVESMQRAMNEVCGKEESERLRRLGLERARRFDWKVAANKTLEVYHQTAAAFRR